MSTDHKSPKSLFPPVSQPSQYTPPPRRNLPAEIPRIPDHDDPSTEWLPIYNTRTPYDEAEIVHLIHEIVRNFVRLSTVSEAEVIWPPEGGHRLDEALCNELNISDAAWSLIRLLPCPGNCICPIFLYQSSQLFDILDNGFSLRSSRESPSFVEGETPASECYILTQDVMLSAGDPETPIVILDTIENTIRVVPITDDGPDLSNPPNTLLERPNDVVYYRNYWPRHAPSFLRMQLNRIKALDAIPPGQSALGYIDFADEWMRRKIKHYLEGTYGWPDNFNQQAWDEDRDRIWEETEEEYERLGRPHVLRFL
ncbi:hypothetical protein BELL_0655g00070 [Botrytis elliptica]|uniref:Uncharacterized protein n=1 Tax=Botrytis elliptica TaxID=278938 RepID=A0A4Z1JHT8_9HELO|nr:hypothetical protein EAE99_005061 [Botrytis elliptica]TGO70862.1 hypothetical protein BELL_0655g00070 [Botrytis elliptica]